MSGNAGSQFTPEQILDAGRRAEAEGRNDLALQFYRHLAEQHRGLPEALLASEALARLQVPPPSQISHAPLPAHPLNGINAAAHAQPPWPRQFEPALGVGPLDREQHKAAGAVFDTPRSRPVELPPPLSDYGVARFVARLATWLGAPMALLGLSASAASVVVGAGTLGKLPIIGALFSGPGSGISLAFAGLVALVGGQFMRAILDLALATRDIASIMRANGEAASPPPAEDDRPRRRPKKRRM